MFPGSSGWFPGPLYNNNIAMLKQSQHWIVITMAGCTAFESPASVIYQTAPAIIIRSLS